MSSVLTTREPIILPVDLLDPASKPFDVEQHPYDTTAKAEQDRNFATAVQYVDFFHDIPDSAQQLLAQYKRAIDHYGESAIKRIGYCARVADHDIKNTPWLAISYPRVKNHNINVSTKDFHAALAKAILEGFVSLPASEYGVLESVFKALTTAVENRANAADNIPQYIILQRYEYSPDTKSIRSVIRTALFEVTEEMVEVQRKKSSSTTINVMIVYSEYEAQFNMDQWESTSKGVDEWTLEKMARYVKDITTEVTY